MLMKSQTICCLLVCEVGSLAGVTRLTAHRRTLQTDTPTQQQLLIRQAGSWARFACCGLVVHALACSLARSRSRNGNEHFALAPPRKSFKCFFLANQRRESKCPSFCWKMKTRVALAGCLVRGVCDQQEAVREQGTRGK